MTEAAERLGVPGSFVRKLIRTGILPAEQVVERAPYQIRTADLQREQVANALAARGKKDPGRRTEDVRTLRLPGT